MALDQASLTLVESLVLAGSLTAEQADRAAQTSTEQGMLVAEALLFEGLVTQADLVRATASSAGLDFVDLTSFEICPDLLSRLPADLARRHNVIPFGRDSSGRLLVASTITTTSNLVLKDDIERVAKEPIIFVVALKTDIATKVASTYRDDKELVALSTGIENAVEDDTANLGELGEVYEEAPIVRFVDLLIEQAIKDRASDIHVEPFEHILRVRYRVDGVLREAFSVSKSITSGVISRLKIMSDLDIAEKRVGQDGRMSRMFMGKPVDLRVATMPTAWGEKVAMRILDNSSTRLSLADLNFSPANEQRFAESYVKPYGMMLVTGPTGSGKSTTLYATLNQIAKDEVNVITVEDPIEFRIHGINQVPVNTKAGMTFASALRSILRSDPDIVLIGEIRDHETAQIAIEAALTGHLVLTTLHTTDAPSAITRLVEMGIEPFLVGSALDSVLAQRLARVLCPMCKAAYEPEPEELLSTRFPWKQGQPLPTLYRPVGCVACANIGFKGRLAIHEVMTVTPEIERLTVTGAAPEAIKMMATQQGMLSLREDGFEKVLQGMTTIKEILRVVV